MTAAEEEFLRSLRATFKVEAAEHLQEIGTGLLELEKAAAAEEQQQLIETVFRAAHSLKGAARAVNFTEIESLCQSLEDLFSAWKRRESLPTPSTLDAAHRTVDKMSQAIVLPAAAETGHRAVETSAASPQPVSAPTGETETVRITVNSLDARLLEAEEMLAAKLAADQRASDLGALAGRLELWRKEWARVQPRTRALRPRTCAVWPSSSTGITTTCAPWREKWRRCGVRPSRIAFSSENSSTICWRTPRSCSCCRWPGSQDCSPSWFAICAAIRARKRNSRSGAKKSPSTNVSWNS